MHRKKIGVSFISLHSALFYRCLFYVVFDRELWSKVLKMLSCSCSCSSCLRGIKFKKIKMVQMDRTKMKNCFQLKKKSWFSTDYAVEGGNGREQSTETWKTLQINRRRPWVPIDPQSFVLGTGYINSSYNTAFLSRYSARLK